MNNKGDMVTMGIAAVIFITVAILILVVSNIKVVPQPEKIYECESCGWHGNESNTTKTYEKHMQMVPMFNGKTTQWVPIWRTETIRHCPICDTEVKVDTVNQ